MANTNTEIIAMLETNPSQAIRGVLDTLYLYNPATVNDLIAQLNDVINKVGFEAIVVDALPETGKKGTIYFVPSGGETPNVYNEYVWVAETEKFEMVGSAQVDLSNYYTKDEIDDQLIDIVGYIGDETRPLRNDINQIDKNTRTVADWVNAKDEEGNRAVLETEAQDAYRAINELNQKIGSGGDYLPLSGGEITGRINYNAGELTTYSWKDKPLFTTTFTTVDGSYTYEEAGLYASTLGLCLGHKNGLTPMLTFRLATNQIEPQSNAIQLGTYANVFASVATKKIVSGIDTSDYSINEIIVPEKKGTMLVNQATGNNALTIGGTAATSARAINIGFSSSASDIGATAIGYLSQAKGISSLALGGSARTNALGAIQINASGLSQTNSEANTLKVANANGNFELMSADGTMPTDRYTTTPTDAGTYVPKLTIAEDGTATREWGTESGGTSGDYLPLSGGTLTGTLEINPDVSTTFGDVLVLSYGDNDVVIQKSRYSRALLMSGTTLTVGGLMATVIGTTRSNIGSPTSSFGRVYTAQLSGSTSYSDEHYLSVPNKDGTIATVEDIEAVVGDISTALTAILGE